MWKFEPKKFWIFTGVVIGITILTIIGLIWFAAWGHEPLEPIHDEEPHATLIEKFKEGKDERIQNRNREQNA